MKVLGILSTFVFALLLATVPSWAQPSSGEGLPGEVLTPTSPTGPSTLAASPPAGQVARYVIPTYVSQTAFATRSVAIVSIHNSGTTTCNTGVQFQFAFGTTNICSITQAIPAGQSRIFCSRPVSDPLPPCSVSCPGGGLTFNTGHAFVSSGSTCRIAVDAQQYYTRDAADDFIESQSRLSVVKVNASNLGD